MPDIQNFVQNKSLKNDGFLVKPFYFGTTLMAGRIFLISIKNYKVLINSSHSICLSSGLKGYLRSNLTLILLKQSCYLEL